MTNYKAVAIIVVLLLALSIPILGGMTYLLIPLAAIFLGIILARAKTMTRGEQIGYRILITLLIFICILTIAVVLFIILSFSNETKVLPLVIFSTLFLLVLIPLMLFKVLRTRYILIIWMGFILINAGYISATVAFNHYHDSIPELSDSLWPSKYLPYRETIPLAELDEPSTLIFTDTVPTLDGATALYPVYAAFAKAVYPKEILMEDEYPANEENTVACLSTRYAYERLFDGEVDIIFVAGPSDEQLKSAVESGAVFTSIGREGFVFFVNAKNPVDNLTQDQIKAIYSGKIRNWQEVGGRSTTIRAFQRNAGSGSQSAFLRYMEDSFVMTPPMTDYIGGMGGIIRETADYKNYGNAIGFSFRFFTQEMVGDNNIKLLKIDGIAPTPENIRNGSYPLTNYFYAVTLSENKNPKTREFIRWILSEQGQELIEKTGYSRL